MNTAITLPEGTAVILEDAFHKDKHYDVYGFLIAFTFNNKVYKYYSNNLFKIEDQYQYQNLFSDRRTDLSGYYIADNFLQYIQEKAGAPSVDELYKSRWDFTPANVGEWVSVDVLNISSPYGFFYKQKRLKFQVEAAKFTNEPKKYKKPVFDDRRGIIGYEIDAPSTATPEDILIDLNLKPTGYFFNQNFGDFIDIRNVFESEKQSLTRIMTLTCFKIHYIVEIIFPKLVSKDGMDNINKKVQLISDANKNQPKAEIVLSELEEVVFSLKKIWGYYYDPDANSMFTHKHSFNSIFDKNTTYEEIEQYYYGLAVFYDRAYLIQDDLKDMLEEKRLGYLLEALNDANLLIIPYELRVKKIMSLIKMNDRTQKDERLIVKLVQSIEPANADQFLDFLVTSTDKKKTAFQLIYESLDDARLERYPIVQEFVDQATNRKFYCFAIYQLWLTSKYNMTYVPPGVQPDRPGINPNAYFLDPEHKKELKQKNVLMFRSNVNYDSKNLIRDSSIIKFESSLKFQEVEINHVTVTTRLAIDRLSVYEIDPKGFTETKLPPYKEYFGSFHLFHPIAYVGYNANEQLNLPQKATIPAFLFHYAQEFNNLSDFDARLALVANLTVDAILFYFTGGASVLSDLRYLRYTTQFGRAMAGELLADTEIYLWAGLEAGGQTISFTAAGLSNIQNYLITTENDPEKRKILEGFRELFLVLELLAGGSSAVLRRAAVNKGTEILARVEALTGPHGLDDKLIDLLRKLKGENSVAQALFGNKINSLEFKDNAENFIAKYWAENFSDEQKLAFRKIFGKSSDDDLRKLNIDPKGKATKLYMNHWTILYNAGLDEASDFAYILSEKMTESIDRYYQSSILWNELKLLSYESRKTFITYFGNTDETFFKRLLDEPKAIERFGSLSSKEKAFARLYPHEWIEKEIVTLRFKKLYVRSGSLYDKLSKSQIVTKYSEHAWTLVETVEMERLRIKSLPPKKQLLGPKVLVSAMIDKTTGKISNVYNNFLAEEREAGEAFDEFIANLHPNLKNRLKEQRAIRNNGHGYNMNDLDDLKYTGQTEHTLGFHAEFRALDDLARQRFESEVSAEEFDNWLKNDVLGYNVHLKKGLVMSRCADCFYLTDLVTFIE